MKKKVTLWDVYDAATDTAIDSVRNGTQLMDAQYFADYADAMDVSITREHAQLCAEKYAIERAIVDEGGSMQNNRWHKIQNPLSEIEIESL